MYLKSLVLKGFKSFADTTDINFEPGVTVVVGPNGSGKSNIVDAVAWVLGAQGPSIVRSSKMEDVIFAGNSTKPALGRAEVILTVDNSARRLPIDLSEVTISRVLFRSGDSEYFINGAPCRLLDIQELLSDTGVGRSQHVIISQGQIDAILTAKAEERRAVIEEAAGVLKFRRRKEKAERRLLASQANLDRVQDTMREVRRQIGPLKKQATAAIRHSEIINELYSLRLYQSGRELTMLQNTLSGSFEIEARLKQSESELSEEIRKAVERETIFQQKLIRGQDTDLTSKVSALGSLKEKTKGLIAVIVERRRLYETKRNQVLDEQVVNSLEAEAEDINRNLTALNLEQEKLAPMTHEISATESQLQTLKITYEKLFSDTDSTGDNPVSKYNEYGALLEGLDKARNSTDRLLSQLKQNQEVAEATLNRINGEKKTLSESIASSKSALTQVESYKKDIEDILNLNSAELNSLKGVKEDIEGKLKNAQIDRGTIQSALSAAMSESGAADILDKDGIAGILSEMITIKPGYDKAVSAALGPIISRAISRSGKDAIDILIEGRLNNRAPIVIPAGLVTESDHQTYAENSPPPGFINLVECVEILNHNYKDTIRSIFDGYLVFEGENFDSAFLDSVQNIFKDRRQVIVTLKGDRFSRDGWRLKSDATSTVVTAQALNTATSLCDKLAKELETLNIKLAEIQAKKDKYESELTDRDFEIRKLSYEINAKESQLHKLEKEFQDIELQKMNSTIKIEEQSAKLNEELNQIAELTTLMESLKTQSDEYRSRMDHKRQLSSQLNEIQELLNQKINQFQKLEATLSERRLNYENRLAEIEKRLEGKSEQRNRAKVLLEEIEIQSQGLAMLQDMANRTVKLIDNELVVLNVHIETNQQSLEAASKDLESERQKRGELEEKLLKTRDEIQKQQISQAEIKVKLDHVRLYILNDIESTIEEAATCPEPVLPPGITVESRLNSLEKEIKSLGPVNALADVELRELEERYNYLFEQLEDIKRARRELNSMIRSIDEEIAHEFESAFMDVKTNYRSLLEVLFPGGSGDLVLTDEEHLLETGIEIEAKPAGRTVKKLSLLSGGERSLVAMAFLFAVFRSRPSPFYLMDEVEAALDDLNLSRFLNLVNEFRTTAQLIIVSHQKRTMENADALYGVSMQPGGSTKVVSEKLNSSR